MKTAKKIIIFIVCSVMLSLSFFSSAAAFSADDLFEYGYVYDGVSYALPSGYPDPLISYPATLLSPEPNVPGFDPKKLPWSDAPSYIQDLIYMSLDGAQSTDASTYKMPFVLVRVSGTTAIVFVGYNVGLGFDIKNNRMRLCVTSYFYNNSACYRASFSVIDYSLIDDWRKLEANQWGSEDYTYVKSYTSTLAYPSSTYDFYMYGGNGVRAGDFSSALFPLHSNDGYGDCYFTVNNQLGFQSGRFFYAQDSADTVIYCQTFIPPTVDQQEQETQKGIWQSIKDIPAQIGAFFDKLINYILYLQPTEPEREEYFSGGVLTDIDLFINENASRTGDFVLTLDDTLDSVSVYIEQGTSIINTVFDALPILNACFIFLLVFAVVRKVVGR